MAIERKQIFSDELLEAPLVLVKNLESLIAQLNLFISKSVELSKSLASSPGMSALKKSTEELSIEQKELIKIQNQIAVAVAKDTDAYRDYEKQLADVKKQAKQNKEMSAEQAQATRAETSSIENLGKALAKNKQEYAKLTTEKQRASKEGKELLKVIQKQDSDFKKLNGSLGDFKSNVGNYVGALSQISPAAGSAAQGIMGIVKASMAFLATPIGIAIAALGAAIFALTSYFRGSEEGQDRLNRIIKVGQVIFEKFMDVVEDVGEAIFNAFSKPRETIEAFGALIKENIQNRITGIMELIPRFGKVMDLVFAGKFVEAGKLAADSILQIGLGVEKATEKISNMVNGVSATIEKATVEANKLADLESKIDKDERKLIVERAKIALDVAKLREKAVKLEGDAKKKALTEAIALEQNLTNKEVELAETRLELAVQNAETFGRDKAALKEIAEAEANLYNARKSAYDNTLKFQKQLEALRDEQNKKEIEAAKLRAAKLKQDIENQKLAFQMQYDLAKKNLDDQILIIKKEVLIGNKTKADGEKEILQLQKSLTDEYIQIQIDRLSSISKIEGLSKEERLKVDEELYKLKTELQNAFYDQLEVKEENNLQKTQEFLTKTQDAYSQYADAVTTFFSTLSDNRLAEIDREEKALQESLDRRLVAAGDNEELKLKLQADAEKQREAIEKKRIAAQRKAAIFDKVVSAVQAGIATALAVTKALPNYPLAIAVGIAGALQVGAILAKKIPEYADGTKGHKGGPAIIGHGHERVTLPSGESFITPAKPMLVDLPAGTKVQSEDETMRDIALKGLNPYNTMPTKRQSEQIFGRKIDELIYTVNQKPVASFNITKEGLRVAFENGQTRNYFLSKIYR